MNRTKTLRSCVALGASALAFAGGCSVLDKLDDVKPLTDGQYEAGAPPPPFVADGATPLSEDASFPDGAADAGRARDGVIVVGGQVADDAGALTNVLTALDPVDGTELARDRRERMAVAAIRYDGLRDLWFVFESGSGDFVPGPHDHVYLHVRRLDTRSGAWTELEKVEVPVLHDYDSVVVLRDRIVYVAFGDPDGGSALRVVTLDTSDPSRVTELGEAPIDLLPFGILGTSSSTGPGGTANMMRTNVNACDGGICDVEIVSVRVPNAGLPVVDPPLAVASASRFAAPSVAALTVDQRDALIVPRLSASDTAHVHLFEPLTKNEDGTPVGFAINDSNLKHAAAADCARVLFVVGTNGDLNLYAVPLAQGGTPAKVPTGHSGQAVYFEPFTSTVIATFDQGAGYAFTAFHLSGTSQAPVLAPRGDDWRPPPDLRPLLLQARFPLPFTCP